MFRRSIAAATTGGAAAAAAAAVAAAGIPATTTTSMPAIDDVGALLFAGREHREGDDGSGVATTEDDGEDADAEAREYARDFLEVALRRLWEGRFGTTTITTKTTETSKVDEHDEDVVTRSMLKTLCEGVRREMPRGHRRRLPPPPPEDEVRPAGSTSSDGSPEAPIVGDDRDEGGHGGSVADETTRDGARTTTTTTELGSDVRSTARRRLPTTSAEFRRTVGSVMPAAIARAEESLMDLEGEMDESFLPVGADDYDDDDDDNNDDDENDGDGDGDERGAAGGPMQRFGDRVDEIVDAASSIFLAVAEENGDVMTKSDGVWVEGE